MSEKNSARLFFFTLLFSPLAFGTVETWSYAVMESASLLALLFYLIQVKKNHAPLYRVPGILPLFLLLLYILFQAVPLPAPIVKMISPAAFALQNSVASAVEQKMTMTLSVHPRATLLQFFRYSAYVAFYFLTVQLLSRKELLMKTVLVITCFGAILAFSSILQFYLTEDRVLWFRPIADGTPMGPYVNRNHYAGLMEMIFPVSLALFFFYRPKTGQASFFKRIAQMLNQEKANIHILIGTGALLIVTSIFVCISRGGIISTAIAILFFMLMLAKKKLSRGNTTLVFLVVILAVLSVSWFGWDRVLDRFGELKTDEGTIEVGRFHYWEDSVDIIKKYPVFGSGFGTFKDMYPSVQTLGEKVYVDHAHNDYIELLTEGGIVGFLLVAAFIITIFYSSFQAFRTRRDTYAIYIYAGSITGIIAILFHSFGDFNLQIGANGLWFFFTAGLAVSAANTRLKVKNKFTNLEAVENRNMKRAALAAVCFMTVIIVPFNLAAFAGSFYYKNIEDIEFILDTPFRDLEKIQSIAAHAAMFDPLNAEYAYTVGDASWFLSAHRRAEENFLRAIALNPASAKYLKRYGVFLVNRGRREQAEKLLALSVDFDRTNSEYALEYGALLVANGKHSRGVSYLKRAVGLNEKTVGPVLTIMAAAGFSMEEMAAAVPDKPGPVIAYARMLSRVGRVADAEKEYMRALRLMDKEESVKRRQVFKIYNFFRRRNKLKQATVVLERAEELLPFDAGIKIAFGDLYRHQGILYKAQEKYEEALLIDPTSRKAQQRLNQ